MPRRPTADSPTSPLLDLHPTLQATLHCMDVRLEDELARYRRARRRSPVQSRWGNGQPMAGAVAMPSLAETSALAIAPNLSAAMDPEPMAMAAAASAQPFVPETESYGDYLESSEELLRGLREDEGELRTQPAPRMLDTLLTPLGVGSMVLLLLSSVTLGYVITNPTGLPFMQAGTSEDAPSADPSLLPPSTAEEGDTTSFYPDLSSQEFRDLNLDTLSTLPANDASAPPSPTPTTPPPSPVTPSPSGSSATTAAPSMRSPAPTAAPASRASTPTPQRSVAASRPATTAPRPAASRPAPAPRPAATPTQTAAAAPRPATSPRPAPRPAPATAPTPNSPVRSTPRPVAAASTTQHSEPYYYVVTDYTGDRSLDAARQAVGDAYVRNFEIGAVVQFGAFSEADRAEALIQELQQQGIAARIYQINQN